MHRPLNVKFKSLSIQSERFTLVVGNQSESMNGYNSCVSVGLRGLMVSIIVVDGVR